MLATKEEMKGYMDRLLEIIESNKSLKNNKDREFLKFSNFVTNSSLFFTFMNGYANEFSWDDSKNHDKWMISNDYGNNDLLHKLVEYIDWGDIDFENLTWKIPELKEELDQGFSSVYEFMKREIENYKHFAKTIKYSKGILEIEEEKIEDSERYRIPKYDNSISYDEYSKKIKEYESSLSR